MKKLFALLFLSGWAFMGYAQEMPGAESNQNALNLDRKNVIKFLPVNLAFNSVSFEFERMINAKNAVTLGVGIPSKGSVTGKYSINTEDIINDELSTMHIRAAYRHYTGNSGLPKGFYIEPYLKYQKVNGKATASVNNDQTDASYDTDFKADFHTWNAGFQVGVQFLIAKRVALDLYFIGLEAGLLNGSMVGTPSDASNVDDLTQKFEDGIHDFPLISDKLTVTSTSTDAIIHASNALYPFIRGGISIGITF